MTRVLWNKTFVAAKTVVRAARAGGDRGAAAVEFALVLPVLCTLLFGILTFGITMSNYIQLSNGDRAASRVFGTARGGTTPVSSSITAFNNAAPLLSGATFVFKTAASGGTLAQCGTTSADDSACATAITNAGAGGTASVTTSYSCNLTVMGINYLPSCSLSFTTASIIE
jgi:Flp pilus assembly protein TadG